MFGILRGGVLLAGLCVVGYLAPAARGYDDVDEKFSYEKLARNRTELKKYLDCFMSKGPCDQTADHYKSHIKDAAWNACRFCSATHRHNAHVFLAAIMREFPEEYKEFKRIYDREGSHFKAMEDVVDKY